MDWCSRWPVVTKAAEFEVIALEDPRWLAADDVEFEEEEPSAVRVLGI
ncbi:MAG: hypothetical protein HYX27_22605 [Acidobacteria bacterium]|nr:hypothetical protein [Acidobacteriota bacterium]